MKRDLVIGEFERPDDAVRAGRRVRELGYASVEAYTPYPIPELDEALAIPRTRIPFLVFGAGASGVAIALFVQWWTNAWDYPLDVGGRPLASWPTYVIIVFETMVLLAALTAFAAVLVRSGLPRLHHPDFDLAGFERTTIDRFWITVGDLDPADDDVAGEELRDLRAALAESGAVEVRLVRRRR
jgi:hypothetical protein